MMDLHQTGMLKIIMEPCAPICTLLENCGRRDDLLLTQEEIEANFLIRKAFNSNKSEEAVERIIETFRKTKSNQEFIQTVKKIKII